MQQRTHNTSTQQKNWRSFLRGFTSFSEPWEGQVKEVHTLSADPFGVDARNLQEDFSKAYVNSLKDMQAKTKQEIHIGLTRDNQLIIKISGGNKL